MEYLHKLLTFDEVCEKTNLTHGQLMSMFMRGFIPNDFIVREVDGHKRKYKAEIVTFIKRNL